VKSTVKAKSSEITVTVIMPVTGFPRVMYFNRFEHVRLENGALVTFGLVDDSGFLLDSFACFFSKAALVKNTDSLTRFWHRVSRGEPRNAPPAWKAVPAKTGVAVADVIGAYFTEGEGEIVLASLAIGPAFLAAKGSTIREKEINPDPVALLRSPIDAQLSLLQALFIEGNT
jgi:hypothetical protein